MSAHDRLPEGELAHELAERLVREAPSHARPGLLLEVLEQTRGTRQLGRRRWWPGSAWQLSGSFDMPKVALAGILVVVIGAGMVVLGGRLAGRGSLVGAPPEASPRPAWITDQWNSDLDPGVPYYFDLPARVTFKVPAGWSYLYSREYGSVIANDMETAAIGWFVADNLYRDPCHFRPRASPSSSRLTNLRATGPR